MLGSREGLKNGVLRDVGYAGSPFEVMRVLRDVGYAGMVMPDHIPQHPDPASALQGHAFCFGYIKALIHAVGAEA